MKLLRSSWTICRWCSDCVGSFVLWTLWLLLSVLLVLQLVVASSRELKVPTRIVRSFENRMAIAGVRFSFDSASFDLKGNVLIEKLRLYSDTSSEPVALCDSALIKLDPLALTIASIEPTAVSARGITLFVPPMLSPTGASEPIASGVDLDIRFEGRTIQLDRLSGQSGTVSLTAHGAVRRPRARTARDSAPEAIAARAMRGYLQAAKQLARWKHQLAAAKDVWAHVVLHPDENRLAHAQIQLLCTSATLNGQDIPGLNLKQDLKIERAHARTEVPLNWDASVPFTAELTLADAKSGAYVARDLRLEVGGTLDGAPGPKIRANRVRAQLQALQLKDVAATQLRAEVHCADWPNVSASLIGWFAEDAWTLHANGNIHERSGYARVDGRIFHPLLRFVGQRVRRDLNQLLIPDAPAPFHIEAYFAPGGRLSRAQGKLDAGHVDVRNVILDAARARLKYEGGRVEVSDIVLAQGESIARGSYTMDAKTLDFRFLLKGSLRPIGIAGWFGKWWPNFWSNFNFEAAVPKADVDIQGRWREPHVVNVFVSVDAAQPTVRTVEFDRVRTTLFVRPQFYDALEVIGDRPEGQARGWFTRTGDDSPGLGRIDFGFRTSVDLHDGARIFAPVGPEIVSPFRFSKTPRLSLNGWIESRQGRPRGEDVDIEVQSTGDFWFFEFPLADLNCTAKLTDGDISVQNLRLNFAGGDATGQARVAGKAPDRRLSFDGKLNGATLGDAIRILEEFGAKRRGQPPSPESRFQQRVAPGKLDLQATAEGLYQDPYSYVGTGNAELRGAELAEINLLGALSQALRGNSVLGFTSWSLDTAKANFTIERNQLDFSDLVITGPSAKLDAKGVYALDTKTMNFNAKFYPFDRGKTFLANAVDLMLTPVSAALELKLAGTLDKPKWYFAYGPTSLLRKLTGSEQPKPEEDAAKKPEPPLMLRRSP
jgi:hypothetical protein